MANNYTATTNPTASNGTPTYNVGDFWLNTTNGKMFQCRVNTSGAALWISDNAVVNVKDFGAVGDGSTNDTTAVNSAAAACAFGDTLYFPAGTYLINLNITTAINLRGAGQSASTLTSYNDNSYAVVYACTVDGPIPTAISDLSFGRQSSTDNRGGVQLGASPPYATNQEYNGAHAFERVGFTCAVGVYKVFGEIGNSYIDCAFTCSKYCVYAWNASVIPTPAAPSLSSVSGGTQPARTAYVRITYSSASGETDASPESSLAMAANNLLVVSSPSAPSVGLTCTGWNVYAATRTGWETKQNSTPIAIGTNWQEPSPGGFTTTGAPAPSGNMSGVVMHSGCDYYTDTVFAGAKSAALYYDSVFEGGQVVFRGCIIQGNNGFGLYVNSFAIANEPSILLDSVWFEANGGTSSAISTTGPGGTTTNYTSVDLFAQKCKTIVLRDGTGPVASVANGTCIVLRGTSQTASALAKVTTDASSAAVALDGVPSTGQTNSLYYDSLLFGNGSGAFSPIVLTKPRSTVTHRYASPTLIYSNSFSCQDSITVGSLTSHIVADGTLFDSAQELTIPANNSGNGAAIPSGLFNVPAGQYCVWTLDLKVTSSAVPAGVVIGWDVTLGQISDFTGNSSAARWCSYASLTSAPIGTGVDQLCGFCIYPNTTQAVTIRYAAFQVLAFGTLQDALQFLLSGKFALNGNTGGGGTVDRPRVFFSTQAPSTGSWNVGDTCYNVSPIPNDYIGWVCTTMGTPGTWKQFGATHA